MISADFHPWTERQGQSSFVGTMLGDIAQLTERITIGTTGTCPTTPGDHRRAAATAACPLLGSFLLGVGTGENLNEHISADHWPESDAQDLLEQTQA